MKVIANKVKQSHEIAASAFGRLAMTVLCLVLFACQPTYKKETLVQSVREMAQKEYGLDVEVALEGDTLGLRFDVENLFGELVAEDQMIWKRMDDLMLVLSRITISADRPPLFFVLELVDRENPSTRMVFTRNVTDIKKAMSEVISRTEMMDRLLIEFVINGKRVTFDPSEADLVRLMMLALEANEKPARANPPEPFTVDDVSFADFVGKVAANTARRLFREESHLHSYMLRDAQARFDAKRHADGQSNFMLMLDLVMRPGEELAPQFLEKKILPVIAKEINAVFKSYQFQQFHEIIVMDKNSGRMALAPRR